MKTFTKSFLQQEALPEEAITAAAEVMRSGRLHRYDATEQDPGHAALLEQEFAAYQGSEYCLAVASCGYALYITMVAAGVKAGDRVLCNAFTLAPVPGAINNCGASPLFVESNADLTIDLHDLERKAPAANFLLLSHMRGHVADMDGIMAICAAHEITLIEDCAHTLGAWWGDRRSGSFGRAACFSTQSYKHMNSGEGGLLVTDDPDLIARAIILSGSYMLYGRHLAAPPEETFADLRKSTPNYSGRMDNLRAATLRPQIPRLDENCARWNRRAQWLADGLAQLPHVRLPRKLPPARPVASSIQFFLEDREPQAIEQFVEKCASRGVQLKYFGAAEPHGYTSRYDSWEYIGATQPLPQTLAMLGQLVDMRVPLVFDEDDCRLIAEIIGEVLADVDG